MKGLQEQRLAHRQKVRKYPPSKVYLQVLGSGAPGAPKSLYVFTEQARSVEGLKTDFRYSNVNTYCILDGTKTLQK